MKKQVKISCTGAALLDIDQIKPFQGSLKELSKENYVKLRKAIEDYGFSFPVFVWRKDGNYWNIDGHQRISTLKVMQGEGWTIPPLPVVWIDALDEKEAKTKLLLAVGQYGKTTYEGLNEFICMAGLDFDLLEGITELPGIDFNTYEKGFSPENKEKEICEQDTENECPKCGYKW